MKLIFYMILFLFASCSQSKRTSSNVNNDKDYHLIKKIKEVGDWVIIYTSKGDSSYKIISKIQPHQPQYTKIRKGNYYHLELNWIGEDEFPKVSNYADVSCFTYDSKTTICIEPQKGIYKLYYSPNIKGRYYLKE